MFVKIYITSLIVFFAIDMVWLGLVAKDFYRWQIGHLMKADVNWIAAIIFYLIFITGLVIFVISPAIQKGQWIDALIFGALFGLVCYATYDLTNLAVAKDWPILITIVDLIWGTILASSVSTITYFIVSKINL